MKNIFFCLLILFNILNLNGMKNNFSYIGNTALDTAVNSYLLSKSTKLEQIQKLYEKCPLDIRNMEDSCIFTFAVMRHAKDHVGDNDIVHSISENKTNVFISDKVRENYRNFFIPFNQIIYSSDCERNKETVKYIFGNEPYTLPELKEIALEKSLYGMSKKEVLSNNEIKKVMEDPEYHSPLVTESIKDVGERFLNALYKIIENCLFDTVDNHTPLWNKNLIVSNTGTMNFVLRFLLNDMRDIILIENLGLFLFDFNLLNGAITLRKEKEKILFYSPSVNTKTETNNSIIYNISKI